MLVIDSHSTANLLLSDGKKFTKSKKSTILVSCNWQVHVKNTHAASGFSFQNEIMAEKIITNMVFCTFVFVSQLFQFCFQFLEMYLSCRNLPKKYERLKRFERMKKTSFQDYLKIKVTHLVILHENVFSGSPLHVIQTAEKIVFLNRKVNVIFIVKNKNSFRVAELRSQKVELLPTTYIVHYSKFVFSQFTSETPLL